MYLDGVSAQSVGSESLCMILITMQPHSKGKAHLHENHETAIYVLRGSGGTYYGENLEHYEEVRAGEMFYIPAGIPHLPVNPGDEECVAVIARSDPNEQESVMLLPHLDELVK